ncbi:TY-Chap2 family putative peptide chaperone [Tessaracoccus sp. Y1736]
MTARDEILEAAESLAASSPDGTFSPADVIEWLQRRGTKLMESTIRTHVVSRMCANAPVHHTVVYTDLERVSHGRYRLSAGSADIAGRQRVWHDARIHEVGESTFVPTFALRQALAWWVGAELVRRHPDSIRLIEVFPHQYGPALTVWEKSDDAHAPGRGLAFLTLGESFHVQPLLEPALDGRLNWLDVLLAPNRRHDVVERLEAQLQLTPPTSTPSATDSSIGPRVIAAFLQRTALDQDRWVMTNGAYEDDDGAGVSDRLFESMPEVALDATRHLPELHPLGLSQSRYWFLCPIKNGEAGPPVRAVDTTAGVVWLEGERVSMMDEFRACDRSLDRLVSSLMPPAL